MNGLRKIGAAATAALAFCGALGFGGESDLGASNGGASGARRMEAIAKEERACFALLIGVDKYDNLRPLNYAGADANALRDALLNLGFSRENVWMLTSDGSRREQPTKKNIEDALDEMLAETGPDSTVFVAFSGHGYETKDGAASFCPKDVEVEKTDGETYVAKNTAITVGDVAARLRADDAKFKILFVDACREPASTRGGGRDVARPFSKADVSGLAFLQSCRSSQLSYEDAEFKGGIFTRYFIEGLSGAAERDDGGTSFLDVCGYAASKTKERALETHKATQTPFYEFSGSDFWLKEPTADVAEALYREGRESAFGLNGAKIDGRRGLELLTKAADAGSTDAQAELAELYLSGCEGTSPDATRAFGLAFEPARRGNPFALNVLGRCYVEGRGVAKAEKKAATCFERAFRGFEKRAKEGDVRAKTALAAYWTDGIGGERDVDAGFTLCREAANAGDSEATRRLGVCYENGIGTEKDEKKAVAAYRKSAEAGNAAAAANLGYCYQNGVGVAKNGAEAAKRYREAVEAGGEDASAALVNLAELYENGDGVSKNEREARKLRSRAVELGNSAAALSLGTASGEARDYEEAASWYRRAFELAEAEGKPWSESVAAWARLNLGLLYENGVGVPKDVREAKKLYRDAAASDDETARARAKERLRSLE